MQARTSVSQETIRKWEEYGKAREAQAPAANEGPQNAPDPAVVEESPQPEPGVLSKLWSLMNGQKQAAEMTDKVAGGMARDALNADQMSNDAADRARAVSSANPVPSGLTAEEVRNLSQGDRGVVRRGASEVVGAFSAVGVVAAIELLKQRAVKAAAEAGEAVLSGAGTQLRRIFRRGSGNATAAGTAETALEVPRGVGANRSAGNAARDYIAEREAPALIEQNLRTTGGLRRLDVLKEADDLIGIESKVGRTSLTPRVRQELARDVKLLRSGQLDKVRWEFWQSARTGRGGPSAALRQKLEKFGIEVIEHDKPF